MDNLSSILKWINADSNEDNKVHVLQRVIYLKCHNVLKLLHKGFGFITVIVIKQS